MLKSPSLIVLGKYDPLCVFGESCLLCNLVTNGTQRTILIRFQRERLLRWCISLRLPSACIQVSVFSSGH